METEAICRGMLMKQNNRQVTFGDLAAYTGFSKTTISRYFNRPDTVTEQNREKISEAMRVLGYQENKVAQILAKGKTEFIGIIVPTLYYHYFSEMLTQILNTYDEFGYKYIVFSGSNNPEKERRYMQELLSYQIEGLIVMNHTLSSQELSSYAVPVVTIEREDKYTCSVNCDNYTGGIQAASLLEKHHCDILIHLNSPEEKSIPAYQRQVGFLDYCRDHDLAHTLLIRDIGPSYDQMYAPVKDAFEEMERLYPDKQKGVFCTNDTVANMLLNLIIRKYGGLSPLYKIVGFDNSPISEEAAFSISTVGQQINVIAKEAVLLLHEKIRMRREGIPEADALIHKVIVPVLYPRETTEGGEERNE